MSQQWCYGCGTPLEGGACEECPGVEKLPTLAGHISWLLKEEKNPSEAKYWEKDSKKGPRALKALRRMKKLSPKGRVPILFIYNYGKSPDSDLWDVLFDIQFKEQKEILSLKWRKTGASPEKIQKMWERDVRSPIYNAVRFMFGKMKPQKGDRPTVPNALKEMALLTVGPDQLTLALQDQWDLMVKILRRKNPEVSAEKATEIICGSLNLDPKARERANLQKKIRRLKKRLRSSLDLMDQYLSDGADSSPL